MSQEPKKPVIKEKEGIIEDAVKGCPFCMTEFEEAISTNAKFTCPSCEQEVLVRKF